MLEKLCDQYYMPCVISLQLGKYKEALDFAVAAQCVQPTNVEVAERVEEIKKHLTAGML